MTAPQRTDVNGTFSPAWRGFTKIVMPPAIRALMRLDWSGQQNFPADGGMILAPNHLSYMDVLAVALFAYDAGRYPVFLAKSSLFELPLLGTALRKLGQLPVYRDRADAGKVLSEAEAAIAAGECVIFYAESTVTRDPEKWPMTAKTGVARCALTTGAPVVPIAHWGAQEILPYGSMVPRPLPRKTVRMLAGPPVDLAEFRDQPLTARTLRAATDKIMTDVAGLLGRLRGATPPAEFYHPAKARRELRRELRALQEGAEAAHAGNGADAAPAEQADAEGPPP
jgi:1-acyl-sn-glycerol-3-phosphate acyltransferase